MPYQGINVVLLWSESVSRGFTSSTWMTFKQSVELGGHVRKGESGTMVVYANKITKTETDDNGDDVERTVPFLRAYTVFCVDQIEGLPAQYYGASASSVPPVQRIANADSFFGNTGATIRHSGDKAYFAPLLDLIQMPPFESFRDAESYAATLAHECVHWTAPAHRVNRDLSRYAKDRSERAREELVAELGACFLSADLGIVPELEPRADHASYLASWLEVLSNDKRFIFSAAAHAQRAVTYLHDLQPKAAEIGEAA
jgi:antirestriction protein ArdC